MLRVVAHTSAAAAKKYYAEGLKREDYYSENQEIVGKWYGRGAELLGLEGKVGREAFARLAENRHPVTGEQLTPRTKDGRRVGYDINFHAPKSLSVLHALTGDKAILAAFRKAVSETMTELEERAETRVRRGGGNANRVTGNLVYAEFVHFTSRPVGGIPDPHLHAHCFTFNTTFDAVEGRWKAGQFGSIKRDAHYAEAAFHARLSGALAEQGYRISRKKGGWEIEGVPASVIQKFSRRTAEIEKLAEELGVKDAKARDALGAATRQGKRHGLTNSELQAAWSVRLTEEERAQISKLIFEKGAVRPEKLSPVQAVDYAISKLFERQSVVERGHLLAAALRYGAGSLTPESVKVEFERRGLVGRKIADEHLCTTIDVLAEEVSLLGFVRAGRNTAAPMAGHRQLGGLEHLSEEQRAAVKHLVSSRDQVIALKGGAGVGKTTLMKEAVRIIEQGGLRVFAFAPSAVASRETLRESGFANANTVAHLFSNQKLQRDVRGQVIWVDEAGLLGTRELWRIMEIAGPGTRVILTGDAGQHAPVARGDAFRLLQKHAGLKVAEVTEIRRQEVADYKEAIAAISKGDLKTGFKRLEKLGAFVEIGDAAERYRQLAADYLRLGAKGTFPLVVSPTHSESGRVTGAIREARRAAGQLGQDREVIQFRNLQWEEAEKRLPENFAPGMIVQFHQNAKGIKRGESFRVVGRLENGGVEVSSKAGKRSVLPLAESEKFLVYEESSLKIAKGDLIRITRNGESKNGKRLNNGNVLTVEKFGKRGEVIMTNGVTLAANHGHIAHGYCQTSHSSQSKTVRDVLIAQSSDSFVASSREQFYVSCSRGKQTIRIYTDNRCELLRAVGATSTRMSGFELAELTSKDLTSFMATELGARQWRESVQSRRGHDGSKTFVKHLVEQRKGQPERTANVVSWKGYIEMQRNNAGPDGRSRSKGHPAGKKKGGNVKGKGFPKISQHSKALTDKMKAAHEEKLAQEKQKEEKERSKGREAEEKKPESRREKTIKVYQTSSQHFTRKYAEKTGGKKPEAGEKTVNMGGNKVRPMAGDATGRAADHSKRQKTESRREQMKTEVRAKAKTQAKAPQPGPVKRR